MEGQIALLRPEEVARRLAIGRTRVYEMIARGEIPVVRLGRSVRVPEQALRLWVEARTAEPTAAGGR